EDAGRDDRPEAGLEGWQVRAGHEARDDGVCRAAVDPPRAEAGLGGEGHHQARGRQGSCRGGEGDTREMTPGPRRMRRPLLTLPLGYRFRLWSWHTKAC